MPNNYCPNPCSKNNTTGYTSTATGAISNVTNLSTPTWNRATGARATSTGTTAVLGTTQYNAGADLGGKTFSIVVQFSFSVASGSTGAGPFVRCYNSANTYTANLAASTPSFTANGVTTAVLVGTAPSGCQRLDVALYSGTMASGTVITLGNARIDEVNDTGLTYADGDTSGWIWSGTNGSSTSIQVTSKTSSDSSTLNDSRTTAITTPQPSELRTNWANKASGITLTPSTTTSADKGPNFNITSIPSTVTGTTANNRLEVTWPNSTQSALYLQQTNDGKVTKIGCRFAFGPSADATNVGGVLCAWDVKTYIPSVTANINSQIHFGFNRTNWNYDVIVNGTVTNVATGTYPQGVLANNWTIYNIEVNISGSTATITFPNGATQQVTDSRINTYQANTAVWEFFKFAAVTTGQMAFIETWAGPNGPQPNNAGTDSVFALTDSSSVNTTGSNTYGVESSSLTESSTVAVWYSTTESSTFNESSNISATHDRTDTSTATDTRAHFASNAPTDTAALTESTSTFQGLLKDSSDTANLTESASVFATHAKTDSATQADTRQGSTPSASLVPTSSNAMILRDNPIFYARGEPGENDLISNRVIWNSPAGTAQYAEGRRGSAFDVNGTRYHGANNGGWLSTPLISVEAWFKLSNAASGNFTEIARCRANSGAGWDLYIYQTSRQIRFAVQSTTGNEGNATSVVNTIQDNTWYHVVGTYDGTTRRIYVNGVLAGSDSSTSAYVPPPTSEQLRICQSIPTAIIDDIAIYDYALTAQQVANHYNEPFTQEVGHFSETKIHGPRVTENITFTDIKQLGPNYVTKTDSLVITDLAQGNFQFVTGDLFTLYEIGVDYEKPRITEDPFVYPQEAYGSGRTRVIAQDHFTREFIHWDLPVDNIQLTFSLSGPNIFSGTISTEMESVASLDPPLTPDRTWIHVEQDDFIIASFILSPFIDNPQSQTRSIEGEGFGAYPHWIYYQGDAYTGVQVDPADMIRKLWDHCQSFPDGNLGVRLWNTQTPVRIGYPAENITINTVDGNQVSFEEGPYVLNYWSVINCGEEINRLCAETPIEYREYSRWNENRSDVEHYLVIGYPRVGRKREDLGFREGQNLVQLIPSYQETIENYASDVLVVGAGEGPTAIRAQHSERIGRLRKTNVIHDQEIYSKKRAQAIADFEFKRLSLSRFLIESITIDTTHFNSRWGTFIAGDDAFIQCTVPYIGYVQAWYRITSYTYNPYTSVAELTLAPSDSFSYGAANVDPYLQLPKEGYAVLSSADYETDDPLQYAIYVQSYYAVGYFNRNNVPPGKAYAYIVTGNTVKWQIINFNQVLPPWELIIGRSTFGNLVTGNEVYLITKEGTIGQAPDSTNDVADPTSEDYVPNPPGLIAAAKETKNAYYTGMLMDEGLRWVGMSNNAFYWNPYITQIFYARGGTYVSNSPNPGPSTLLPIIMDNIVRGFYTY